MRIRHTVLIAATVVAVVPLGAGPSTKGPWNAAAQEPSKADLKRSEQRKKAGARIGVGLRTLAAAGAGAEQQRAFVAGKLAARSVPVRTVPRILAKAELGVTLRPTAEPRTSRLGGEALVSGDDSWPTNDRSGRPLSVLAVLDLAELRAPAPLPPDGTLVLYYDASGPDGDLTEAWLDMVANVEVRWIPAGAATRLVKAPQKATTFPTQAMAGTPLLIVGGIDLFAASDRTYELLSGLASEAYSHDQLLGASQDIQGPVLEEIPYWFKSTSNSASRRRYSAAERQGRGWTLIAQVGGADSDEMMFGDSGNVSFAVPTADLATRRFDRAVAIFQTM